ncbi:MAG: hypothetical protein LBR11_07545 [Deltaproteobacteria bacterium]|jgi:hypothetical protein|nr:hypothetical protein [Deltaproteobacteria bacterium]
MINFANLDFKDPKVKKSTLVVFLLSLLIVIPLNISFFAFFKFLPFFVFMLIGYFISSIFGHSDDRYIRLGIYNFLLLIPFVSLLFFFSNNKYNYFAWYFVPLLYYYIYSYLIIYLLYNNINIAEIDFFRLLIKFFIYKFRNIIVIFKIPFNFKLLLKKFINIYVLTFSVILILNIISEYREIRRIEQEKLAQLEEIERIEQEKLAQLERERIEREKFQTLLPKGIPVSFSVHLSDTRSEKESLTEGFDDLGPDDTNLAMDLLNLGLLITENVIHELKDWNDLDQMCEGYIRLSGFSISGQGPPCTPNGFFGPLILTQITDKITIYNEDSSLSCSKDISISENNLFTLFKGGVQDFNICKGVKLRIHGERDLL